MYNECRTAYIDFDWVEPPTAEVIEDIDCPQCNGPMEWQKSNFQFYCCSCDECWDHPDDKFDCGDFEDEVAYGY